MASKAVALGETLVGALQRFAAAQGCCWVVMKYCSEALQLAVESSGDFDGFRSAIQALNSSSAFALLKVNLSEAKGGLQVDSLGRQKTVFFTYVPAAAPAFERATTSEAKSAVRTALGVVVHVEYTVENASDIDEAAVLMRVKQSTGGMHPIDMILYPDASVVPSLIHPPVRFCSVLRFWRRRAGPGPRRARVNSRTDRCNMLFRRQSRLAQPLQRSTPSPRNLVEARASCCDLLSSSKRKRQGLSRFGHAPSLNITRHTLSHHAYNLLKLLPTKTSTKMPISATIVV